MKKRKLSLDERDDEPEEEDEEAKEMTISSAVESTCGLTQCLARLIEDYTVEYKAGDWCVVEQPVPYKRYKLGVMKKIVMDRLRRVWQVQVHECGRDNPVQRASYTDAVRLEIEAMETIGGYAPRYTGLNPWMLDRQNATFIAIVNVYTHKARVPYRWLYPVMINVDCALHRINQIPKRFLRIVASGSRETMEEMFRRIE
jgi:hypothetical protein